MFFDQFCNAICIERLKWWFRLSSAWFTFLFIIDRMHKTCSSTYRCTLFPTDWKRNSLLYNSFQKKKKKPSGFCSLSSMFLREETFYFDFVYGNRFLCSLCSELGLNISLLTRFSCWEQLNVFLLWYVLGPYLEQFQ